MGAGGEGRACAAPRTCRAVLMRYCSAVTMLWILSMSPVARPSAPQPGMLAATFHVASGHDTRSVVSERWGSIATGSTPRRWKARMRVRSSCEADQICVRR